MSWILAWSCGPVQDFIVTARKGRDLWFGSWLLSEVSRAAARVAAKEHGVEALLVPAPERAGALDRDDVGVPNRLLIHGTRGTPEGTAQHMTGAARQRLEDIASAAFGAVKGEFHRERALAQVRDLLEVVHAAVAVEPSAGFPAARRRAEILLAARKTWRRFSQPSWAGHTPKSSLDGARESVVPEAAFDLPDAALRRKYGAAARERLCGVALLKRFGHRAADSSAPGARIHSTSHVASAAARNALDPDLHAEPFRAYVQALRELDADLTEVPGKPDPVCGRYDGGLLYPGRLGDLFDGDVEAVEQAEQHLRHLYGKTWKEASLQADRPAPRKPSPYFAILVADGDHMGAWFDGKHTVEAYREASLRLATFTGDARKVVENHLGQVVYAGGDDVLALLPASTALDAARELARAFRRALQLDPEAHEQGHAPPDGPTLSVGICVAHHVDLLRESLEAARAAEGYAKEQVGRNAWAVILRKRSGAPLTVGGHWSSVGSFAELLEIYTTRDDLPRGLPYDLREAGIRLQRPADPPAGAAFPAAEDLRALEPLEARRVLSQKGLSGEKGSGAAVLREVEAHGLARAADRLVLARALSGMSGGDR